METTCIELPKDSQSVCSELNLDVERLREPVLLANPTYRRLYNIVRNDVARSDLAFRRNLIKELYFLLQITPVVQPALHDNFLSQVQKWYNLNDHKKIDLASNKLSNLYNIVNHSRQSSQLRHPERPASGIIQPRVSPFLRPYTAFRPLSGQKRHLASTQADTEIPYLEFPANNQEQIQVNQDYANGHRTSHPQYEPVYEQLCNILKKAQGIAEQTVIASKRPLRNAKSAMLKTKKAFCHDNLSENFVQRPRPLQQQNVGDREEPEQSEQSSNSEEEYLYVKESQKQTQLEKEKQKIKEKSRGIYQQLQRVKAQASPQYHKLHRYSHLLQNKLVQAVNEDIELTQNYVNFARAKSALRTQQNRKLESRRLLSAQKISKIRSRIQSNQNINQDGLGVFDLAQDPKVVLPDQIKGYPTYNRRQVLQKMYHKQLDVYRKREGVKVGQKHFGGLTKWDRLLPPERFNPLSQQNVKKYNQQVLEEIEKIKQKVGGTCYASTESLMRALYVQEAETGVSWEGKDICFGLISKGVKPRKLKKKGKVKAGKLLVSGFQDKRKKERSALIKK